MGLAELRTREPKLFGKREPFEQTIPLTRIASSFEANGLEFDARLIDYGDPGDPGFEVRFKSYHVTNQRFTILRPDKKPVRHKAVMAEMEEKRSLLLLPGETLKIAHGGMFGMWATETLVKFDVSQKDA